MESKNKFWKGALVGALVTAFAGLIIVGISTGILLIGRTAIGSDLKAESSSSQDEENQLNVNRISGKVAALQQLIDQYYLFDEDVQEVEDWIYKGMLYGLEDPYTAYYTAEEYAALTEETEGQYHGIGVMVSQDMNTGIITVIQVFDGPAKEAGMKPGDILYKVGDTEVSRMDLNLVVSDYIKGDDGTFVDLTVYRESSEEYIEMSVERRQVEAETVECEMLADKTGYITVTQFDAVTTDQFKEAVDDLEKQGMESLVIDLRNNPGGVLDTVVSMLDYMLPDDLVIEGDPDLERDQPEKTLLVYISDKRGEGTQYYCSDGHEVKVPVAVLVNDQSASASEVFAGAMKDYGKAEIVGVQTFGKGIVQTLFPLDNGTAVKMTTAHYFTPSGQDIHGKGIEPDVLVELNEELKSQLDIPTEEDNQLQEAIKVLVRESGE